MLALGKARKIYADSQLVGSADKDIVAQTSFKAAGAEVRSSTVNVRCGFVPVGASLAKRISLSVLSLRAAVLPGISASLLSRLCGNWVSVLQHRKCWSSLIDDFFKLSSACQAESSLSVHKLQRSVALELTCLTCVAPLICSNVAVDYLDRVFASDASNQKGAVVSAPIDLQKHEALWLAVDKKGTYTHLDNDFRSILRQVGANDDDLEVGLESVPANDIMLTSSWEVGRSWFWKKLAHINELELASAVSNLGSVASSHFLVRFASFLDFAVCRGALAKGRSASFALQPGLKRACAWCIVADLYLAWPFSPTRLNVADDPTRGSLVRKPVALPIVEATGCDIFRALSVGLRRFAANWTRLVLLVLLFTPSTASGLEVASLDFSFHRPAVYPFSKTVRAAMILCLLFTSGEAMQMAPMTEVERQRCQRREGNSILATRAIKKQTRDRRKVYLDWFRQWLWTEKGTSFRFLIDQKPADPEKIAGLLIDYGKSLYRAGKAYGVYPETINSISVERPLIRRSLVSAWDLAFAWLANKPHAHHPALPLSITAAMVVTALYCTGDGPTRRQ
eukprot:s675_g41.t1